MKHPNWPTCPKCKSQQVKISEFWINHVIIWFPDDLKSEGVLNPGEPYTVYGECYECGHEWSFRCGGQVKDLWWEVTPPSKRVQTDPLPAVDDGNNSNSAGG